MFTVSRLLHETCYLTNRVINGEMDVGRVWLSSKAAYRPHKGKKHSSHFKKKEDLFRNGTTRDKEAAKVIITKVRGMNRQGLMKLIKDGQDKGVVSVFDCCKRLDLDKEGMVIVSRLKQQIGGQHEETVPVVRVVEQQQARKAYSDYLSEQVTKRLRISNPGLIRKQERGKNSGEENGIAGESGDYKVVRVSWQITTNDLKGQKRHEIETQMKKGENVRIVFDDKNNFERTHGRRIGNGEGLSDIETTKRDKVVKFIGELIDELGTSYEEEGSMQDKLIFKVKALQNNTVSKEERRVLKDQRKMERQERLRMNTERKRARQMEDLKILSVD